MLSNIKHFWTENHQYIVVTIIALSAITLSEILRKTLRKYFYTTSDALHLDKTRFRFFINLISFIIYGGASTFILFYIPELRTLSYTVFAGAGILAAIIGFASQQAFANIISGFFIVTSKPFNVGDWIRVGEYGPGQVEDITLRHTILRDFKNSRIVLPNSVINNEVLVNETLNDIKHCEFIDVPIGHNANVKKAIEIIKEIVCKHKLSIDNRTLEEIAAGTAEVDVKLVRIEPTHLLIRAYVWTNNSLDGYSLKYDVFEQAREKFIHENIDLPYQPVKLEK